MRLFSLVRVGVRVRVRVRARVRARVGVRVRVRHRVKVRVSSGRGCLACLAAGETCTYYLLRVLTAYYVYLLPTVYLLGRKRLTEIHRLALPLTLTLTLTLTLPLTLILTLTLRCTCSGAED